MNRSRYASVMALNMRVIGRTAWLLAVSSFAACSGKGGGGATPDAGGGTAGTAGTDASLGGSAGSAGAASGGDAGFGGLAGGQNGKAGASGSAGGAGGGAAGTSGGGGAGGGATGGTGGAGSGGQAGSGGAGTNQPPVILTATTNTSVLTQNQSLTITVFATDPDGAADLVGGLVRPPGSSTSYGALVSSGQAGSYSLTLTWAQLDTAIPITTPIGGADRSFEIEVFDTAGASATQTLSVKLACPDAAHAVCNGKCQSVSNDTQNCGACGFSCLGSFGGTLMGSTCVMQNNKHYCRKSDDLLLTTNNGTHSCASLCAASSPQAAFTEVSCEIGNVASNCSYCPGTSSSCPMTNCSIPMNSLPAACKIPEFSYIECDCKAFYPAGS